MGAVLGKGGSYTTGFRYYFSILMGVCRGPVDSIFLMKADNLTFWDGSDIGRIAEADKYDPYNPNGVIPFNSLAVAYSGGEITDNRAVPIAAPQLFGGDKGEGGLDGIAWIYMGGKAQTLTAPTDYINAVMTGVRLSALRGVTTVFYDGEVAANNPYPKPWTFRVRRTTSGWDRAPWYPQRAMIQLSDPSLPTYTKDYALFGGGTLTAQVYDPVSNTYRTITSTYSGSSISTYTAGGSVIDSVAVPLAYNDIHAMNPAHIVYECITNRDWGRGLDPLFLNEPSFIDAANTLFNEDFGLCLRWSRTEDVDIFLQNVLDHCGGVLYTDKISGLLCLRLIRSDYVISALSMFDYTTGLLEVTSVETAANDAIINEVIVNYYSPVLDAQKEARQQNLASINRYGCVFSVTKDYSGLPTSILALRVAARDLKAMGSGYKKVEFKVDRRGYSIVPGDVLILNVPDRGISNLIVRVATVDDTVITDGAISIVAAQDVFGLPETPTTDVAMSTFLEPDLTPKAITNQYADEATYRDMFRALGAAQLATYDDSAHSGVSFAVLVAQKPTPSSLNFDLSAATYTIFMPSPTPVITGTGPFAEVSKTVSAISTTDTTFDVTGSLLPLNTPVGSALTITDPSVSGGATPGSAEFVRLDAISTNYATGKTTITVARGAVDTAATAHPAGSSVWAYDAVGVADRNEYDYSEDVVLYGLTRTSRGVLAQSLATPAALASLGGRPFKPYIGGNFRVNGYPRDNTPPQAGALAFTWNERNKFLIQDKLVGEVEATTGPEPGGLNYIVVSQGGVFLSFGNPGSGNTTLAGSHVTAESADLTAAGFVPGPIKVQYRTYVAYPPGFLPYGQIAFSWDTVEVDFTWLGATASAPTGYGWGLSFGSDFGGGTMLSYSSGFGTGFGGTGP